jgi:outer membrane protein TolC
MKIRLNLFILISLSAVVLSAQEFDPAASITIDSYIAFVLINNEDLKLSSYKVKLAEAGEKSKKREDPVSLTASANLTMSDRLGTDIEDKNKVVTKNTDDISTKLSKTFFTGTNVGISYGYSFIKSNSNASSMPKYNTNNISFSLSQPLLSGLLNKIKRREQTITEIDHEISELNYQNTIIATVIKAIEAYYNLELNRKQMELSKQSLEQIRMTYKTQEELAAGGFSSKDKLIQYQTQILEKENEYFTAVNTYEEQRANFLQLINRTDDGSEVTMRSRPMLPESLAITVALDTLIERASSVRPDYLVAQAGCEKANLTYSIQKNALLPSINLTSNYNMYGTDVIFRNTLSAMVANDNNSWAVGLNVSAPLGNKTRKVQLLGSEIALNEAQYKIRTMNRTIRQELQSTINKLLLNYKQYQSAISNNASATINIQESRKLLDKGFISLDEFLKSKKNQESSALQMYKSQCEYTINWYKFKKANGTLLDFFSSEVTGK